MMELHNEAWIRVVARLNTSAQLQEFINLSTMLSQETLTPGQEDRISWKWITDDVYSSASVYAAQFHGAFPRFATSKI